MRHLKVRSRNFSCKPLAELEVPIPVVYRMGSTTPLNKIFKKRIPKKLLEINSIQACKLSGNKYLMKKRFNHARIRTAPWFVISSNDHNHQRIKHYLNKWDTIIAKRYNSSKGKGIYLIQSLEDYFTFKTQITVEGYHIEDFILERYYTYTKEYRIHVTKDKCFYAARKMLIKNAQDRWHRHGNNSVFVLEDNPAFDRPENWEEIVQECINALKALGLDIAAFDVKVSKKGKFIIMESNSAPALGEFGLQRYKEILKEWIDLNI
jgi:glutathione synthase/RimK-type ligase-like ATP-grasp enzyme